LRFLVVRFAFRIASLRAAYLWSTIMKSGRIGGQNSAPSRQTPLPPDGDVALCYVRRAEELFRRKAKEPVTLAEAAACAGCSLRTLQLAFRRCRGMTPMAALRRIRLEAARAALADGPTPICAIAAAYRFTNPGRFARLFKEVFGQSPSELRRAQDRL
jgi:transcriptional regulator GlxA family with amidase domain